MKICPFCAEEIQDAAIVCKHCRRDLPGPKTVAAAPAAAAPAPVVAQPKPRHRGAGLGLVVIGFLLTLVSKEIAGLGIIFLWIGLGLSLGGNALIRWAGGFLLALVIGGFGMATGGNVPQPSPVSSPASVTPAGQGSAAPVRPAAPVFQLALISSRGYESEGGGYHIVEGQIKNISDQPLSNVTAVSTWLTKDDTFITSDNALIDYNPILPGQTSPFKTMSTTNPAMSKYTIEFKQLMGGTINMRDDRKK